MKCKYLPTNTCLYSIYLKIFRLITNKQDFQEVETNFGPNLVKLSLMGPYLRLFVKSILKSFIIVIVVAL